MGRVAFGPPGPFFRICQAGSNWQQLGAAWEVPVVGWVSYPWRGVQCAVGLGQGAHGL